MTPNSHHHNDGEQDPGEGRRIAHAVVAEAGLYELVYNSCLRAGIDMERAWQSSQISSSLSMVNAGFGFALVPQSPITAQKENHQTGNHKTDSGRQN